MSLRGFFKTVDPSRQRIRQRWPAMPVIICGGYLLGDTFEVGFDNVPHATIPKPFSTAKRVQMVLSVLPTRR